MPGGGPGSGTPEPDPGVRYTGQAPPRTARTRGRCMAQDAVTAGERSSNGPAQARGEDSQVQSKRDRVRVQHGGSQPTALTRRPEAIAIPVADLLEYVHAGRIRVPRFQRPLKWGMRDTDLLLDSIHRGYPIGTLLFWKKPAAAAAVQLGPVRIDAPARQDAWWVVDGPQRITALTGVLTGPYDDVTADHVLFFDLHEQRFQRASKKRQPLSHWLPLDRVIDSHALFTWLRDHGDTLSKDAISAAVELGKRIREYRVPTYVVESEGEQPLRDIFARINRGGQPLAESDVFRALRGDGAYRASEIDELTDSFRDMGFGNAGRDLIRQAILAVQGRERSAGFKGRRVQRVDKEVAVETVIALQGVAVFLRKNAGIPHLALLPYRLPLLTLVRFFHQHPEPAPRSLQLMARWLWRGAINGRHQGEPVVTASMLRSIVSNESEAVQNLLRDVGSRPRAMPPLRPYRHRDAHSKLLLLALWALQPRHLGTGAALHIADLVERSSPAQPVKQPSKRDPEAAMGLPNRLLHPPLAGGLRKALIAQTDAGILTSHGISAAAHTALASGDFATFLRLREETLRPHVENFLEARAQWQASDRPPLADLIIDDEDED
jgi:hypothetical protein